MAVGISQLEEEAVSLSAVFGGVGLHFDFLFIAEQNVLGEAASLEK
jgi:hypothetical protein